MNDDVKPPLLDVESEAKLQKAPKDPMLRFLRKIIRFSVRALAILMTAIILWGVLDVIYVLYERILDPPYFLLEITDILATFGAFMAVLIAIEIYVNITIYLREDIIHVKIVMATALMAVARKVIVMDIDDMESIQVFGLAAVVMAMSIGYWIVSMRDPKSRRELHQGDERNLHSEE